MVDQLIQTWQIPDPIACAWVSQREIAPLLDGLDEVSESDRDACVDAINHYQRAHGLDPLAVCSRTQQYRDLHDRLDLRRAVIAQRLTPKQIDAYLDAGKEKLAALRELTQANGVIRELMSTPLLLCVISLAYKNSAPNSILRPTDDLKSWRRVVFFDYVQRMQDHRLPTNAQRKSSNYSVAEMTYYLAWLANNMRTNLRTDLFFFEQLKLYELSVMGTQFHWRWSSIVMNSIYRRVSVLFIRVGPLKGAMYLSWHKLWRVFMIGIAWGLFIGLAAGVVLGLSIGLFGGVLVALSFAGFTWLSDGPITVVEMDERDISTPKMAQ